MLQMGKRFLLLLLFLILFRDTFLREAVTRKQLASCFLIQLHTKRKCETIEKRYENLNNNGARELRLEHGNTSLNKKPTSSGVWEPCVEHGNRSPVREPRWQGFGNHALITGMPESHKQWGFGEPCVDG